MFKPSFFGNLYTKDIKKFEIFYKIFIDRTSRLLNKIGVNINTLPLLDIRRLKSNNIIGDRSYGDNLKVVSAIGDFCIKNFHNNKIGTIMKHIPGHGLAKVDSHLFTPIVKESFLSLSKLDFAAFKNKECLMAMTAHIIYQNIDKKNTATHSKKIINIIRNKIKFNGLLISDDLSMKALKMNLEINVVNAFNAGCNIVLHCNGNYAEMLKIAKNSPIIDKFIIKKTSQFYKIIS